MNSEGDNVLDDFKFHYKTATRIYNITVRHSSKESARIKARRALLENYGVSAKHEKIKNGHLNES